MSVVVAPNLNTVLAEPALSRSNAVAAAGEGSGRILALDGLRGFAVLLVFLIHATIIVPRTIPGTVLVSATFLNGFGPFLFFALSAYLITSLLRRKLDKPEYLARFYLSRGLRVLPVYLMFIAGTLLVVPHLVGEHVLLFPQTHKADWAYWVFLQNFIMGIYGTPQHKMLDVTWTLAVDFQFFLVWPLLVRSVSRRGLMGVCAAMIVSALVVRVWLVFYSGLPKDAAYCFTFARLDALGMGALLALIGEDRQTLLRIRPVAKFFAIGAIPMVWAYLAMERVTGLRFRPEIIQSAGYFSRTLGDSIATLGAACLILCCVTARPDSGFTRFFGSAPLRYLGTRAYGFFLVHVSVIWLVRTSVFGQPDPTGAVQPLFAMQPVAGTFVPHQLLFYALTFVLSIGLAGLSYTLIERPIMRLKDRVIKGGGRV